MRVRLSEFLSIFKSHALKSQTQPEDAMREIHAETIKEKVKEAALSANVNLGADVIEGLRQALERETSPVGREILGHLLENARIAREENIPICQDTGLVVIFAELGQEVVITGGDFRTSLTQAIREAYAEGYLRKSVCHPFTRKNTGDNTPIIIHLDLVPGDRLKLWIVPKGGGSENMSRLHMLSPSAGWPGIRDRVVEAVSDAGPNPCPPTIVGIGIGGNFEQSAILAKKALLRPLGSTHPDPELAKLESALLEEINKTGVGPQGLGGRVTSLGVHINLMPCHIASLPLAINIQCHASRHTELVL
jgi:fumarate hydratase subunit alpha